MGYSVHSLEHGPKRCEEQHTWLLPAGLQAVPSCQLRASDAQSHTCTAVRKFARLQAVPSCRFESLCGSQSESLLYTERQMQGASLWHRLLGCLPSAGMAASDASIRAHQPYCQLACQCSDASPEAVIQTQLTHTCRGQAQTSTQGAPVCCPAPPSAGCHQLSLSRSERLQLAHSLQT